MNKRTTITAIIAGIALTASLSACSTGVTGLSNDAPAGAAKQTTAPVVKAKPGSSFETAVPLGTVMAGTDMSNNPFTVSFGSVSWDATAAIHAANQFNESPDAGHKFISVNVTVTNKGTQPSRAASTLAFGINFMGADHGVVSPTSKLAYLNTPLSSAPEIPAGGTVAGTMIFEVPTATVSGAFVADSLFEAAK
jgi:hypothetical protein